MYKKEPCSGREIYGSGKFHYKRPALFTLELKRKEMITIVQKEKWVKFLRVVEDVDKVIPYNKHLSNPWQPGEIVKVVSYEEQENRIGEVDDLFRRRYVNILRKDASGKWTLHYNEEWKLFEQLTKAK